MKNLLAIFESLDSQIAIVDAKVAALAFNDERVKLLMTVPGLNYFIASLVLAEICDVNRFSSAKKLMGWAGLAPSVHQSGDKAVYGRGGRRGNRLVRWVLVKAAQAAVRSDEGFRMFYERYASSKGCQKAVVAVAHEMLRIVYFMLKRNEPYRREMHDLSRRKLKRSERLALYGL